MNALQNEFFEEYKSLDNLCKDLFRSGEGVTAYIEEMQRSCSGAMSVLSWNADLAMLKHVRWLRNQIAHGDSGEAECSREDISFVQSFHERILKQKDPLALKRKQLAEREVRPVAQPAIIPDAACGQQAYAYSALKQEETAGKILKMVGIGFLIIVGILVLILKEFWVFY